MNLKHIAALLVISFGYSHPAAAAEPTIQAVTFKHPDGRSAPAEIYIDGEITPSLPRQLVSALSSNNIERGTIYLNSVGGTYRLALSLVSSSAKPVSIPQLVAVEKPTARLTQGLAKVRA